MSTRLDSEKPVDDGFFASNAVDAPETTAPDDSSSSPRWWRRPQAWAGVVAALLVVGGAAYGTPVLVRAVEHQNASEAFASAAAERAAVYDAQREAVEELHAAEAALTADYPSLVTIATTLTDSTVADPASRADLLAKATEYAKTDLALDDTGAFVVDRPALFDALVLEHLVAAEDRSVSEFSAEELTAQVVVLEADTKYARSYTKLVQEAADTIRAAAVTSADGVDVAIVSAAEKGATLTWEKAPAETANVVAAAAALTAEGASDLALADRAGLVSAYIAAVQAAGAAHQAVLDQEAEAARQAAAAEAERQAAAQRQQRNSNSGSTPSTRGSSGGSPGNSSQSPNLGGGIGDPSKRDTSGQCWTLVNGGTVPCGGW